MGFGANVNLEMSFGTSSYQPENILQALNVFRKNGIFTDVVLQVAEQEFPCHRAVLCASSHYFSTMFMGQLRESSQSVVRLNQVSEVALEHLLNFIYEGQVELQEENVEIVFQAADLLDVSALSRACVDFLEKRVSHLNCLGLMQFAKHYSLQPLQEQCQNLLYQDFHIVSKQDEFLELPVEKVVELLDSEKLQVQEEVLVEAALLWVHHQGSQRKAILPKLLERLRLPLLDPVFFTNMLEADELIQDSHDCRKLLQEARLYRTYGREISSERTKPRRSVRHQEQRDSTQSVPCQDVGLVMNHMRLWYYYATMLFTSMSRISSGVTVLCTRHTFCLRNGMFRLHMCVQIHQISL